MKYLYIPTEITHREIDGHCLLIYEAIKKGYYVFFGPRHVMIKYDNYPIGSWLIKSLVQSEIPIFSKIKNKGHKIVLLDQEGLIMNKNDFKAKQRYNKKTVEISDRILMWGNQQKRLMNKYFPDSTEKTLITGIPRIDFLYKYAKSFNSKYSSIREKYANYNKIILVATSFGAANHFYGKAGFIKLMEASLGKQFDKDRLERLNRRMEFFDYLLKKYSLMIEKLAKRNKNYAILIRPHPSENENYWRKYAEKFENVFIEPKGSISWLILASDYVIQFGSTISIESLFLNKQTITYMPKLNPSWEEFLIPETINSSVIVNSVNELEKLFIKDNLIMSNKARAKILNNYNEIISNYDNGSSSEKILKVCSDLNSYGDNNHHHLYKKTYLRKPFIPMIKRLYTKIYLKLHRLSKSSVMGNPKYGKKKMDGFKLDEILFRLKKIGKISDDQIQISYHKYNKMLFGFFSNDYKAK